MDGFTAGPTGLNPLPGSSILDDLRNAAPPHSPRCTRKRKHQAGQLTGYLLTCIVACWLIWVHTQGMRKTSDVIWQDAQHQVLFELLDRLKQPGADGRILQRLQEYAENHFALEELYMHALAYPDREAHIESHDRFRMELAQLVDEDREFDELFQEIVATFLTEWLTRHVFGIDKQLEAFILQSGAC